MSRLLFAPLALVIAPTPAAAQFPDFGDFQGTPIPAKGKPVAHYSAAVIPARAKPGEVVRFRLTVTPTNGAWTYPQNPADASQKDRNKIVPPPPGDLIFVGPVAEDGRADRHPRDGAPGKADVVYPKATTWTLTAVVSPGAKPGPKTVKLAPATAIRVCDEHNCFSSNAPPSATFTVDAGDPVEVKAEFRAAVDAALKPPTAPPPAATVPATTAPPPAAHAGGKVAKPLAEYEAGLQGVLDKLEKTNTGPPLNTKGLWAFVLTAAAWGLVSLVTPCVFPMIPITVSIFLKQSHQSTAETVKLAGVYCLTIIAVLGVAAVALLKVFVDLSVSPGMNLFLGGLFVFFALSLFGMYDITLPGFLLRFTQKKQGAGGLLGTVFGALAFTIVAFTCVAPFLGGFAGMAASGNYSTFELVLGGLAFSTAFAAPFFVLALFPRLLKALPRSGGWLDSVKVVMGFLELAAALKFLRTAELRLLPRADYFTYDLVLGAWVALSVACGLYLLNVYRLPHDEERPTIPVPRLMFALLFLGFGAYLLPATFKTADGKNQRPTGAVYAWVDAFLLPEPAREAVAATDLPDALKTGRPVFVDFTGVTCPNCRYNENAVFPRADVRELMSRFAVVQLYTDDVPVEAYASPPSDDARTAEGRANRSFLERAFGVDQLPYYAVLKTRPDGRVEVRGVYPEGKINDPAAFAAFLRGALDGPAP